MKNIFLKWERYRILFNVILIAVTIYCLFFIEYEQKETINTKIIVELFIVYTILNLLYLFGFFIEILLLNIGISKKWFFYYTFCFGLFISVFFMFNYIPVLMTPF